MNYNRSDVVIIPFPFVTSEGALQKARPALIISDHSIDRRFAKINYIHRLTLRELCPHHRKP
ncbi:MAG TPA: hypothetical protein C5S37_12790 [Methanophagales archaeon]|nr:hypothetical protein [Methanophagales archaeon]